MAILSLVVGVVIGVCIGIYWGGAFVDFAWRTHAKTGRPIESSGQRFKVALVKDDEII